MQKFWELFQESVIVQAVITLCLVGTACYMVVTGQEIPELLSTLLTLVLGFYFGSKVQQQIEKSKGR